MPSIPETIINAENAKKKNVNNEWINSCLVARGHCSMSGQWFSMAIQALLVEWLSHRQNAEIQIN